MGAGEHRWKYKLTPYEESIRVPLVIRYDPLTEGDTTPALALNVDLAPTIAELAGVDLPGADGRSLVPILSGEAPAVRTDFLIEHAQYRSVRGRPDPPRIAASARNATRSSTTPPARKSSTTSGETQISS